MKNLKELKEQSSIIESQLNAKMSELYEAGVAYPETNEEIIKLNVELVNINKEIEDLKDKSIANIAILKKESIESEISNLEEKLNSRISQLENEGNQYIQMDEIVVNLNSQISTLNNELLDTKNYILNEKVSSNILDFENQYENTLKLLKARETELYNSQNQYPEMDQEVIRLNSELYNLKQQINIVRNNIRIDAYIIQKEQLESKLKLLNDELNNRMNILYDERSLYPQTDKTVIELEGKISTLKESINDLEQKYINNQLSNELFSRIELPKVEYIDEESNKIVNQTEPINTIDTISENDSIIYNSSSTDESELNKNELVDDSDIRDNSLKAQLLLEKRKHNIQLGVLEKYANGEINLNKEKTESFDAQIEKLETTLVSIQSQENKNDSIEINTILNEARDSLEKIIIDNENMITTDEEIAIQSYRKAASLPTVDNIITALYQISRLPSESLLKNNLIDTITKIEVAYIKDEDELSSTREAMRSFNIQPFDIGKTEFNNTSTEIEKLTTKINELTQEREKRKIIANKQADKINRKIANIDMLLSSNQKMYNNSDNNSNSNLNISTDNNDELPPTFAKDEDPKNVFYNIGNKVHDILINKSSNNLNIEQFQEQANKLGQIANEERIFDDTARINGKNDWMEVKTAKALGKFDNNGIDAFTNNQLPIPHKFKSVKKASQKLIEKIRHTKFSDKVAVILNYMKKAKLALITGTIIITAGAISAESNNNLNQQLSNNSDIIKENESNKKINNTLNQENENNVENTDNNQIVTPETDNIDFNTQLQNQINEILNGETGVYTSSDRAISNTDMKMPSASQIENSWTMVEPSVFYDINGNVISEEEAINKVEDGEQIAARMDNDRGTVGYINIGQNSQENNQGMAR